MECNSGSNLTSNYRSDERVAQGRFGLTSTITPELHNTSPIPINCVNNKMQETR